MKSILIIGAGVIGLSIAHELSKTKKFKIVVIERSNSFGSGNTHAFPSNPFRCLL